MNAKKTLYDCIFTEKRPTAIENLNSLLSQACHLISFKFNKTNGLFTKAMFILSVDIDVGCTKLGLINQGKNDKNVHLCFSESYIGRLEEYAIPVLAQAFDNFEVPATFAIRGQLPEVSADQIEILLDSSVEHDIGAHGYTHRNFLTLSMAEAEAELNSIRSSLGKFGIVPKTFIFPRNGICYLNLLKKHGYKCYRELSGGLKKDGMFIEKRDGLFNIQPSLYLNITFTPRILKKILDIAIAKKAPLHLWFHPWTFGKSEKDIKRYIENVFSPFLEYAQFKKESGMLTLETMLSASNKAEEFGEYF